MNRRGLIIMVLMAFATSLAMASTYAPEATLRTTVGADTIYWFRTLQGASVKASADVQSTFVWSLAAEADGQNPKELRRTVDATADALPLEAEGRYQLTIDNAQRQRTLTFWCVAPQIAKCSIVVDSVDCEGLYATAKATAAPVRVFDSTTGQSVEISQKLTYTWLVSDSVVYESAAADAELPCPVEDGVLKLKVANQSEAMAEAADSIDSYGVRAIYEAKVRDREVPNEMGGAEVYSAPAEVELRNLSKGQIDVSEWALGTTARLFDRNPVYAFQQSGDYRIVLTVTNELTGCQSVDSSVVVKVTDAVMEFPDVFTPNGDGTNDEFRPVFRSLKSYSLKVFNRWGRVVYESGDPATGWNGKIGSAEAPEGTYMYVAEAEGFDKGVAFRRKGTVTLLRGK